MSSHSRKKNLSSAKLLAKLMFRSAEQQARFNLLVAGWVSAASCVIFFLAFPRSTARDVILIYNAVLVIATYPTVVLLKKLKIRFALHQTVSTVHYIGIHAWFLYMVKASATPIQMTLVTTLLYGLTVSVLLTLPAPKNRFIMWGLIYGSLPTLAIITPPFNRSHLVWLILLLLGCAYAIYQRFLTSRLASELAEQQFLRQKAETEAKQLEVRAALESSKRRENEAAARLLTMAKTAQMLAHDLKKPFTVIDLLLQAIRNENDHGRIKSLIEKFETELTYSSAQAKGLIIDLIELGSQSRPLMEARPFSPLLRSVLQEVFARYPKAEVSLGIGLEHQYQVLMDERRIRRVLLNLFENALQAMPDQMGQMWVHTHSGKAGQLELAIGNTGRTIPEAERDRVFEAFYTSGKMDGTGLGLAICKKIVAAHGGKIKVTVEGMRTWFHLTLPYAPAKAEPFEDFPGHSREIIQALSKQLPGDQAMQQVRAKEVDLEQRIVTALKQNNRRLSVAVLDPEAFYMEALVSQIASFPQLKVHLGLEVFSHPETLHTHLARSAVDLLICEVQLEGTPRSGFDLVRDLRQKGFKGQICLHSTLAGNDVYRDALHAGAQAYLPKPMSRLQMLAVLYEALAQPEMPHLAVVDDDPFVLECWRTMVADAHLSLFSSATTFRRWLQEDTARLGQLTAVILDYHLGEDEENGLELAQFVHSREPSLPIIVSSDAFLEDAPDYVRLIAKEPQSWAQLKRFAG